MPKCFCSIDFNDCQNEIIDGEEVAFCTNKPYCYVGYESIGSKVHYLQGCGEVSRVCFRRRPGIFYYECCNSNDYCNNQTMLDKLKNITEHDVTSTVQSKIAAVSPPVIRMYLAAACFFVFLVSIIVLLYMVSRYKRLKCGNKSFRQEHSGVLGGILNCFEAIFFKDTSQQTTTALTSCQPPDVVHLPDEYCPSVETTTVIDGVVAASNRKLRTAVGYHKLSTTASEIGEQSSVNTQQTCIDFYSKTMPATSNTIDESSGSGSGRGQPMLVPQTIARCIQLVDIIGRGRYGEVWRGDFCGESVAVKIFASRDEVSWRRETFIFNSTRLRHENIVNFLASDVRAHSGTELWLVMTFHKNGSLFDYLLNNTIDFSTLLNFAYSATRGLHYLHTAIGAKPAMAHRDIKSKNLLVKDDYTLCIADLGLVAVDSANTSIVVEASSKVGTRRYMAPEILVMLDVTEGGVPVMQSVPSFISCIRADMYSFALILWELISRLKLSSAPPNDIDYHIPYWDMLSPDPSVREMCDLIVTKNYRPKLPSHLSFILQNNITSNHHASQIQSILLIFWKLTCECWSEVPEHRPLSLLLKKQLKKCSLAARNEDNGEDNIFTVV